MSRFKYPLQEGTEVVYTIPLESGDIVGRGKIRGIHAAHSLLPFYLVEIATGDRKVLDHYPYSVMCIQENFLERV